MNKRGRKPGPDGPRATRKATIVRVHNVNGQAMDMPLHGLAALVRRLKASGAMWGKDVEIFIKSSAIPATEAQLAAANAEADRAARSERARASASHKRRRRSVNGSGRPVAHPQEAGVTA